MFHPIARSREDTNVLAHARGGPCRRPHSPGAHHGAQASGVRANVRNELATGQFVRDTVSRMTACMHARAGHSLTACMHALCMHAQVRAQASGVRANVLACGQHVRDTVPPFIVGATTMRMHAPAQHAPAHAPEHTAEHVVGEGPGITPTNFRGKTAKVYIPHKDVCESLVPGQHVQVQNPNTRSLWSMD